ncbi:sigma 54-interacting transcriptional regulator [Hyphococcus sp.]|uniref:sigma 54-interacting transcriptional regulator n=1 Tax=Hyphococcus sp. TaxID=2038636 RepID=UPI003CCBD3ED
MDDHEYDGFDRSSSIDQGYAPGGYVTESYVPSRIDIGSNNRTDRLRAKSLNIKKNGPSGPAGKARRESKPLTPIIGSSPQAAKIRELISLYAEDDSSVLISGETGVGKELVAKHLHAAGRRSQHAFSAINAGAVPETLAASILFGHAKGAFTGAVGEQEGAITLADNGVLFLDEIGETPLSIQTHLLRVLEDGVVTKIGGRSPVTVDFRLIAATNAPLRELVNQKQFREDLYYRVNVLSIDVPPLRARQDDMIEIAESMIAGHKDERYHAYRLTPKAADRLRSHAFPGNIRELRNILARALVHARDGKIMPEHIMFDPRKCSEGMKNGEVFDIDEAKNLVSRFVMMKALYTTQGNVTKAAALTGRSRGTLHTLKKSIEGEDFASAFQNACNEMKALLNGC